MVSNFKCKWDGRHNNVHRYWKKARRASKSGTNDLIWWGNYQAFLSWFPREEGEIFLLGAGAEKLCSRLNFGRKNVACVQTSPISFIARGKGTFSTCNKGNRRRLHAGKKNAVFVVTGPGPCHVKMNSVDFVLSREEQWLCILGDPGAVSQLKNFHSAFSPDCPWVSKDIDGGYAIKTKTNKKKNSSSWADTKTQRNTSQVSLFYSFQFIFSICGYQYFISHTITKSLIFNMSSTKVTCQLWYVNYFTPFPCYISLGHLSCI